MDHHDDRIRGLEVELENTRFSADIWRRLYVDRLEERDELKAELENTKKVVDQIWQDKKRLRDNYETLEGTLGMARAARDAYQAEVRDLKDKLDKARQENAKLKNELKHLKALVREHLKALVRETSQ